MDVIRLATQEEIAEIAQRSDLGPGSAVVAFGPDRAVIKQIFEIDPMFCDNLRRKLILKSHLETYLRLTGVPQFYFNIAADDVEWQDICKKDGAEQVSAVPELRFKKVL